MLYKSLSGPITCQIEVDDHCNNNCIHCYNHWRHKNCQPIIKMTAKTLNRIIEELTEAKIFQVTVTGGEPLLNKKILFQAIEKLIQNKISCSVNSNLTLLKRNDAKTLFKLGMRGIMTSFFSDDREKHDYIAGRQGAFEDTLRGISTAQEQGLKVAISMVVTKINQDDIVKTALFLKSFGITRFSATKASPPVNSIDFQNFMISRERLVKTLDDLLYLEQNEGLDVGILECYPLCAIQKAKYQFASKRRCSAGITTCTFGANGDVRPCSHSDEIFGNINESSIKSIWKKMLPMRKESRLPDECIACDFLQECSGGCRIDSRYCFGKINSLDPYAIPSEVEKIEWPEKRIPEIDPKDAFTLNPEKILRKEKGGMLIASRDKPGEPALITHDTYKLLASLKSPFSLQSLKEESGLTLGDARELCGQFISDGILQKQLTKGGNV